ncbi:MAG TPA: M15 family metallopeptidase [Chloroflexia bacterium]|jgi:hypothetical protein
MASPRLDGLVPEFRAKAEILIQNCADLGIEMRPNEGVRTPFRQARYWRQSRSWQTVHNEIVRLKNAGADYLAYCIEAVGPQFGKVGAHITMAIPGYSFHQWGEALDCYWIVNGAAEWSTTKKVGGKNGFQVYANEAKKLGLTAGGLWAGSFKDWPHVQLRPGTPEGTNTLLEIDALMRERYGLVVTDP